MSDTGLTSRLAKDMLGALRLLTRLPLPVTSAPLPATPAVWAWPLAGMVVGICAALVASLALGLGLTPGVAAALVLATQAMATGAMHEDGLADTCDGFWGGWDKDRRLAIMKDSHIGSYGVIALILSLLLRWSALSVVLDEAAHWPVLVVVGALSRAPMAVIMAVLPNARGSGLSQSVGKPEPGAAALALALALLVTVLLMGAVSLPMVALAALACGGLALVARAKIGGQTGDVLGASQQLAEMAALAVVAASL